MIESRPQSQSSSLLSFVLAAGAVVVLAVHPLLLASNPSSSPYIIVWFYASGCAALVISLVLPSSFFIFLLSSFLFVGFIAKAFANLVFEVKLIEPISTFSSQWDQALTFAASGLSGVCLANILAALFPSFPKTSTASGNARLTKCVIVAFATVLVASVGVYWANYSFHILRIGFPLGIAIDPRIYSVAAFIITWGALLGGLTTILWLIELRRWPYAALVATATFLGLLASVSMGSRIQLLLYVLAAVAVIVLRREQVRDWIAVVLVMCLAALIFAGSLAVVSFERTFDFAQTASSTPASLAKAAPSTPDSRVVSKSEDIASGPAPSATKPAAVKPPASQDVSLSDKVEAVTRDRFALQGLFRQLRNLAVMRWVGLEGVMTAAANPDRLGGDLFVKVLSEDPAAGSQAIYQKMSGDRYGNVEYYTFLTLPGPAGVASMSGSPLIVAAFMFGLALLGHSIEWVAARLTQNLATAAVTGVSLAYLTVQMGFPWTLIIYAIELLLSVTFLGVVWRVTKRLTSPR
ncbi:MAG: hypothetical protein EOS66_03960 [Mesorhizobium sp.]|uniref:hypothetical protein n=1 Tax=unclassified Mesorhizobium TaxID=325217 RepID=UPI000FCC5041|nr:MULTISPECIES: hypothetical protein [unclassified Mesorhizobium]RWF59917.1 MAG: hypothetical protein EOS66_03960 [Mesorhizobium sp.]RVC95869.1 hypothetical protein EN739_11275 [Mesorhizobium sp. M2A.F.Ca.ET.017.03.2.1]RVD11588.1 hypothetical protein EN753_01765 [Mesorhizobium sp. M2A.F.Ca.ET.029.05.1.1]TIW58877.1 MAG: hypothetical protein E5V54_00985 [Mesorhizobium sp.]TIW84265.1 MAG: hypothetical protein E5V53_00725 [Mesorhizobium sp.]